MEIEKPAKGVEMCGECGGAGMIFDGTRNLERIRQGYPSKMDTCPDCDGSGYDSSEVDWNAELADLVEDA